MPAQRPRSTAVAQPADPSIPLAAHPVPQLGAAQGAALQVLVCVHHAAPQGRPVARGDADNLDRTHVRQRTGHGGQRRRRHRLPSVLTGITRRHRRQRDDPSAMHLQHRVTAAHVPRPTPGVVPRHPCAHAQRQRPPRDRRFRFHRLPNPSETLVRQGPAADRDHAASVCMRGACVQNILWAILSPEGEGETGASFREPYLMDTPTLIATLVIRGEPGSVSVCSSGLIAKSRRSNENASPGLANHRAPPP